MPQRLNGRRVNAFRVNACRLNAFRVNACRVLAGTLISASIAFLGATTMTHAAEKIIFAFPTVINSGIAPMAFAIELGFFKAEDIEPEIVTLQGSGTIIPQLMSGEIFTAYSSLEPLPIARQPGNPNFAFKFVYNYTRNSIWEIAVLADSKIQTPKDLGGKTVGVGALQWGNVAGTKAIVKYSGVDPSEVNWVAVGTGVPAFQALKTGKIDALNLHEVMHTGLEQLGTRLRRLPFPPEFQGVSSHGFPVTDKMIRQRPDLIVKFGRAMTKGTIACAANTESCIEAYWKLYPAQKPSADDPALLSREVTSLKPRLKNLSAFRDDEAHLYGAFSPKDWVSLIDALKLGGQIDPAVRIDINTLYTNEFVEEYNRFDKQAVIAAATTYRP